MNIGKCKVMSITKLRNPTVLVHNYFINGHKLECVDSFKDLGVIFDSKMKFDEHIDHVINKANRMLGFVMRTGAEF